VRQGCGDYRRARPASPCDDRDNSAAWTVRDSDFGGLGKFGHQFAVLGWQGEHMLCADRDSGLEIGGSWLRLRDEDDSAAARECPLCTSVSRFAVEQDGDRARPHLPAGRFGCVDDLDAGRGGDAIDVVA
jgi:hypothetical protein